MAGLIFALFALGAAFIGAPISLGLGQIVTLAGLILGVVFWALATWMGLFIAFYHRTSANEAFVRTGKGGALVVLDGGTYVIPLFHRKIAVSLETMKLSVALTGRDHALITQDNLRVNVNAEFYIKVKPDQEGILQAARSLGDKSVDAQTVEELVREKLVSALRHAAAQMEMFAMHARRDEFAQVVQEHVRRDLSPNGIDLESVTISALDQLDPNQLSNVNVFDVQGRRKATEITSAQNVETTRLERDAERAIAEKNVETRRHILELQRQQAEAEAQQVSEVTQVRAAREREQREFGLEQERAVKEAQIAQDLAVQSRNVDKERSLQTAEVLRTQTIEVAQREREIAIAQKEAAQAQAEAAALAAQAERERAQQQVVSVQELATAEREAGVKLTAAKQVVEQDRIKRQTDAEVAAFTRLKQAEVEREAAAKQAEARLKLAEAEMKARELEAQGQQALEMVEVNVAREQIKLKQMEVEVERQALENKQTFDRAAIEFEKAKLQIQAEKEARIAMAQAVGQALSHAVFKVYGDPNTMGDMLGNLSKGLGLGALADGVLLSTPDSVKQVISQIGSQVGDIAIKAVNGSTNGHANGSVGSVTTDAGDDLVDQTPLVVSDAPVVNINNGVPLDNLTSGGNETTIK